MCGDAKRQRLQSYGLDPGLHTKDREKGYTSNGTESGAKEGQAEQRQVEWAGGWELVARVDMNLGKRGGVPGG